MAWRYDSGGFLNYYKNVIFKVIHTYICSLFIFTGGPSGY